MILEAILDDGLAAVVLWGGQRFSRANSRVLGLAPVLSGTQSVFRSIQGRWMVRQR